MFSKFCDRYGNGIIIWGLCKSHLYYGLDTTNATFFFLNNNYLCCIWKCGGNILVLFEY